MDTLKPSLPEALPMSAKTLNEKLLTAYALMTAQILEHYCKEIGTYYWYDLKEVLITEVEMNGPVQGVIQASLLHR